jgi:hypothetical protein
MEYLKIFILINCPRNNGKKVKRYKGNLVEFEKFILCSGGKYKKTIML